MLHKSLAFLTFTYIALWQIMLELNGMLFAKFSQKGFMTRTEKGPMLYIGRNQFFNTQ
jgi:hypothetical protein